jgi:hypothetical protein
MKRSCQEKEEKMIGDVLITFSRNTEDCPSRTGQPWTLAASLGETHIYTTLPDDQWHGFPLAEEEDERWQIWLLGELYEDFPSLTKAFEQPERVNGHFLLIGFEKESKRVHVITNRLGTEHAYYAAGAARAALGTFSPAVAKAAGCSTLNLQGIAEFFHFGFFIGNSTYWEGVELLPAATHTILDGIGKVISQFRYWQWHYDPSSSLTYDEAIDQFHELFRTVLTGQVSQKRIALPLSGGLDSRGTLAELGEQGLGGAAQMFPFNYGYTEDSVETQIALQLGKKRGIEVRTWTIQPYLFDQIERVCASVEGFQDITQCRQAYVVDELAEQADYVVAAHWGDVWLDDMGFRAQEMLSDERLAALITKKYSKNGSEILQALLAPNLPKNWKDVLIGKVETSLSSLDEVTELDFKIKAWKTSQWSHRWTLSSLRMYQVGLFPLLPFYDNRLVDFFLRVPSEFVAGRKLQIDYLKRYAPDLAKIKWQPYDTNLYYYKYYDTWGLPRRAIKKLGRLLFPHPVVQRNWEVHFLNPKGRAGLNCFLLEPGLKVQNFFPAGGLEQLLVDFFQNPTARNGYAVSMLLTFSAWLERYG